MNEKFSFHKLFIKLSSRKLWVWIVSTFFVREILNKTATEKIYSLVIAVAWLVLSIVYMIGEPLEQAISLAVSKMELRIQNTINTNISGTVGGQK